MQLPGLQPRSALGQEAATGTSFCWGGSEALPSRGEMGSRCCQREATRDAIPPRRGAAASAGTCSVRRAPCPGATRALGWGAPAPLAARGGTASISPNKVRVAPPGWAAGKGQCRFRKGGMRDGQGGFIVFSS